ncbi:unnamed protein product [Polarella glacialis]|uniref:Fatty acid desaturase domain-containing protein n=1 Tax=Polarella glacialis TaxID=89957 RepID=A0A813K008_POLGL|nr:unnamed protein product [Polarella glacialis]CAE8600277.1 unnamed protein product [Polarella glacialis]CAE8686922.1 unnamed protein product [Polarella glacialis]
MTGRCIAEAWCKWPCTSQFMPPAMLTFYRMTNPYHVLFAIPLGWAAMCISSIGHDGYHHTLAPADSCLNEVLAYLCMDCVVTSRDTWHYSHHKVHHGSPWSEDPMDRQRLFGPCILTETMYLIKTILMYWCQDMKSAICEPSCNGRLRSFFAIFVKLTLLLHMPLNGLAGFVFSLVINVNYFAFLAHGLPVRTPTDDLLLQQLRTSIDFFPHSYVGLFLSGAFNNHSVHHVFPSLPRSLHKWGSDKLRKFFPDEYRVIDNFSQLFAFWVLRDQQPEETVLMKDIVKKAEGFYCKKLILDLVSVVILCAVVAFLPAVRITEYIPSIKQQH